jgi:hypothetical protein
MKEEPATREIPLSISVAPELEKLTDLGGTPEQAGFVARVGESPICHQIPDIFAGLAVSIPADLKLYDRFRLWLVPHRVALLRRRGLAEPVSVGIEVEYISDGGTCSVVSLIPAPQFLHHGELSFNGSIKGSLGISGEVTPFPGVEIEPPTGGRSEVVSGLGMSAKGSGGLSLAFSASVVTPFVSAVGLGSNRAEWRFDRHEDALFGRDIETWAILALSKRKRELRYKIRHSVTTRTIFFPTRTESEWFEVGCTLNF